MNIHSEFNIDKVICDIDVRYYINCSFSKDNGQTWEEDFDDTDEMENYVKSQLPCMKEVDYTYGIWTKKQGKRLDWCPVIDVETGKIQDWPEGFILKNTTWKTCDQGVYVYSNADESKQIVSTDCGNYYVPGWLDQEGDGYGDYIQITINGDGTIENWEELKNKLLYYAKENLDIDKMKSHINILDYIN